MTRIRGDAADNHVVGSRDGERGAAAVEFALVLPLLMVLLFGVVEMSFAFHSSQGTKLAMNDGLRQGTLSRTDRYADHQIASAVLRRVNGSGSSRLEQLVVFRAATPDSVPSASCLNGTPSPTCSVYTRAQVISMAASPCFNQACPPLACNSGWCPSSRRDGDLLGVWVKVRYTGVTGLLSNSYSARATFRDVGVLPIEPRVIDR